MVCVNCQPELEFLLHDSIPGVWGSGHVGVCIFGVGSVCLLQGCVAGLLVSQVPSVGLPSLSSVESTVQR